MEVSQHTEVKWSIRGNYKRAVLEAWSSGIKVSLPNYSYGEARYDSKSEIALLSNGEKIVTAIKCYEHTEMVPLEEVDCVRCDSIFQGRRSCPTCGSESWE